MGMDWMDRLNEAIRYLEEHLTGKIEYERLGQIACCSAYHFQRMFHYLAGVPLAEYIRRRRMSLAAVDLQETGARVIDVAAKYGYASPTAFNRAFQSVHGVSPSAVRQAGVSIRSFPPLTFRITVRGGEGMDYRVETRAAFRIVGRSYPLGREIERNFLEVPLLWRDAVLDGTIERLLAVRNREPQGVLGVSACSGGEDWRYHIAVSSDAAADLPLEEAWVPGGTWAIFPGSGTGKSIQELEKRVVTEWLPTSGFEFAEGPDVEVYHRPDPRQTTYEVWVPVRKRPF